MSCKPAAVWPLVLLALAWPGTSIFGQDSRGQPPLAPPRSLTSPPSTDRSPEAAQSLDLGSPGLSFPAVGEEIIRLHETDSGQCASCDACNGGTPWSKAWLGSGLYAGGEVVFIRPHAEGNQAFLIGQPVGEPNDRLYSEINFEFDHQATGRFWLGCSNCQGVGVRARYWQFDHDADWIDRQLPADASVEAGLGNFTADNLRLRIVDEGPSGGRARGVYGLELETIDLELTRQLDHAWIQLLVAGGLRYVDMDQFARFELLPGYNRAVLVHQHGFEGVGPTLNLEAWCPVGGSRVTLYSQARVSGMLGETDQWAAQVTTNGQPPQTQVFERDDLQEGLFITEFGIGLQYTIGRAFVNAGYEVQIWHGAGGPNSTAGDLILDGFNIVAGRTY